jgi:hypothetical protein
MESLSVLLTGPGEFIAGLLPGAGAQDSEARADLAVTLGIVFWLALVVCVRLAIRAVLGGRSRHGVAGSTDSAAHAAFDRAEAKARRGARSAVDPLRRFLRGWTWPMATGAAWRLQLMHLVVYAAVPLLWVGVNFGFFAVTFPLRILGPGQGPGWYDGALDHLKRTTCWTFVTPCSGPRVEPGENAFFLGRPDCPPGRSCSVPVPTSGERLAWAWFWKLLWLITGMVWIEGWRQQREKRSERPAG